MYQMYSKLPTYEQLRHYWVVKQSEDDLPCAMFMLECDAVDWVKQQQSTDNYLIMKPLEALLLPHG
jgi:hypothetical protein